MKVRRFTVHPIQARLLRDTSNGAALKAEGSYLAAVVRLQDALYDALPAKKIPIPASFRQRLEGPWLEASEEVPDDAKVTIDLLAGDLDILVDAWKVHVPNVSGTLARFVQGLDKVLADAEEIDTDAEKNEAA